MSDDVWHFVTDLWPIIRCRNKVKILAGRNSAVTCIAATGVSQELCAVSLVDYEKCV